MREDKMLSFHINSLSSNYDEKTFKGFNKPYVENDSITSKNEVKKIVHITRHLLTGEATHALILRDQLYDR